MTYLYGYHIYWINNRISNTAESNKLELFSKAIDEVANMRLNKVLQKRLVLLLSRLLKQTRWSGQHQ